LAGWSGTASIFFRMGFKRKIGVVLWMGEAIIVGSLEDMKRD